MATRQLPPLGTRAWEVEWCKNIPLDECGDGDLDNAEYVTRIFRDRDAAVAYAKKVLPLDAFGSVTLTEVELTDPYGESIPRMYQWEAVSESESID